MGSLREGSFLQENFLFVKQIENLLDSANVKSANLPKKMKFYHEDIDMNKLKI